jgi:hypothetical protein
MGRTRALAVHLRRSSNDLPGHAPIATLPHSLRRGLDLP